jgi:hypothetical protein
MYWKFKNRSLNICILTSNEVTTGIIETTAVITSVLLQNNLYFKGSNFSWLSQWDPAS